MRNLTPAERLIVAADFEPEDSLDMASWPVLSLAEKLKGTGVYIKVNSARRACGQWLVNELHDMGVKVMDDLKLFDIPQTLSTDGALLTLSKPEIVTVSCLAGVAAMRRLKEKLPETEVLGVTILTSMDEKEVNRIFRTSLSVMVLSLAELAEEAGLDGVVCSAREASDIRHLEKRPLSLNTPAIRPAWVVVKGDDQNQVRVATPAEALQAGADRVIVGRPITQAKDPYEAVMRTIEEIASVIVPV